METKLTNLGSLKEGNYVIIDGIACTVRDIQTSKTGKHGAMKCRIEAVGIINQEKKIIVKPSSDPIEVPIIEKKTAQVLSVAGTKANVMDVETYETFDLDIPEEMRDTITEGKNVIYWIIMDVKIMKQTK